MPGRVSHLFAAGRGFVKEPAEALRVDTGGARGDRHHGRDPARALLLVPEACYVALRSEGFELTAGRLGENVVAYGMTMAPPAGTWVTLGPVRTVVASACTVCQALAAVDPALPKAAYGRRGVYLRVARGGMVRRGDLVTWTLPQVVPAPAGAARPETEKETR
ncbi:MAG: MOSC domain-containing protein [Trueperaceae bacterium]|nr:MOSC domain-containing protein [Trueperaceae bacterium]